MKRFQGRNVFLTGAASGIGRALAIRLADEGCRLFLADIDAAGLLELKYILAPSGASVWTSVCDLADQEAVGRLADSVLKESGGIDLLINNAGVAYYGQTELMTLKQWNWIMGINLLAPIELTHRMLPSLLSRPDTHLVNMCSISGLVAGGRFTAYHTSKFGLVGFTEALRAEYGRRGLGVTAICPGPVKTRLYQSTATGQPGRSAPNPPSWMSTTPERVAEITVAAIRGNKRQVLITPAAHVLFQLKRFVPGLIDFANQFSRSKRRRQRELQLRMASQQQSGSPDHSGNAAEADPASTSSRAA